LEDLPIVSIMIPTYNQEGYIAQAIESAMGQDYSNLEIVVCDDCSTDHTYEVAKAYELADRRIKVYRNNKNIGRVRNYRHLLCDLASGDWCLMLDGDDYYIDPTFVSSAIAKLSFCNTQSIVAFFAGFVRLEVEHKKEFKKLPKTMGLVEGKRAFMDFPKSWMNHGSLLYRRQTAIEVGGYMDDTLYTDAALFLKLCLQGDIFYIPNCVYVWRVHERNESVTHNSFQQLQEYERLWKSVENFSKGKFSSFFEGWLSRQIQEQTRSVFIYAALHEDFATKVRLIREIKKKYPIAFNSLETTATAMGMLLFPPDLFYWIKSVYTMLKARSSLVL